MNPACSSWRWLCEDVVSLSQHIFIDNLGIFFYPTGPEPDQVPEPPKKMAPRFRVRPRFEPIHFVTSAEKDKKKEDPLDNQMQEVNQEANTNSVAQPAANCTNSPLRNAQEVDPQLSSTAGFGFASQPAAASKAVNSVDTTTSGALQVSVSPSAVQSASETFPPSAIMQKQSFIEKLSAAVWKNLANPDANTGTEKINYTYLLTRSIQACKTNPEYIYVPLKEIAPADLPKSKKLLTDGFACEVRCQNVYLTTGYAGSKNGSRDRAAELAVRLLQKSVEVRVVQRKFRHTYHEDLVVCEAGVNLVVCEAGVKRCVTPPGQCTSSQLGFALLQSASVRFSF